MHGPAHIKHVWEGLGSVYQQGSIWHLKRQIGYSMSPRLKVSIVPLNPPEKIPLNKKRIKSAREKSHEILVQRKKVASTLRLPPPCRRSHVIGVAYAIHSAVPGRRMGPRTLLCSTSSIRHFVPYSWAGVLFSPAG